MPIRHLLLISISMILLFTACAEKEQSRDTIQHPNVLFIAIDDLNDWIEPLGGHPQAKTPHLQAFADGAVNFTRNYCASPGCNPSRSSVLTGILPYQSGMYSNYQDWRKVPKLAQAATLGQYFKENGYYSAGAGKIFHYSQVAPRTWDDYFPSQKNNMPKEFIPENAPVNMPVFRYMYKMFDWHGLEMEDEETSDFQSVNYISEQLQRQHDKSFFLACGIYRPHVPWYVPQKYFDQFPLEDIQLPEMMEADTADLGPRAREMAARGGNYHHHVVAAGKWKEAVRGYLASVAFADAMAGRLLDQLANSAYAENTIVVIWSDHGWQLGEKMHWRKFALWENVIRSVLMIRSPKGIPALPAGSASGKRITEPTSLVDIYPTLLDLCGLPPKNDLDGITFTPSMRQAETKLDRPIITTYDFGDYSVRYQNWHYIRYIDGSEELYDLTADPNEWTNLAEETSQAEIKQQLKAMIPTEVALTPDSSLLQLMEHHVPPIKSREYYFSEERKEWLKRFDIH